MKQTALGQLLAALQEHGPMTTRQMQEKMHLHASAVQHRVSSARAAGLIHVSGYSVEGSNKTYSKRLWAVGSAPDVSSSARRYRENLGERRRMAEKLELAKREIRPFRDPLTEALFGRAA
jgi:DNA-binding Lrp family transcriptional regulator